MHSEFGQLGSPWLAELATLAYKSRPVTVPIGEGKKQAEMDQNLLLDVRLNLDEFQFSLLNSRDDFSKALSKFKQDHKCKLTSTMAGWPQVDAGMSWSL